jgi:hypothetical protein
VTLLPLLLPPLLHYVVRVTLLPLLLLHYVVKDSPQPQVPLAFGLMNTNSDLHSTAQHSTETPTTSAHHQELCWRKDKGADRTTGGC